MPLPTVTVTPGSGLTVNTLPNAGQVTSANSLPVVVASDQSAVPISAASLPLAANAVQETGGNLATLVAGAGALTETAPATDTASSGLNGRLQRVAQRITSLLALYPASLGQKAMSASFAVTVASDQSAVPVSNATLPLPAGAATAANQIGRTVAPVITPTVTSNGAYLAGEEVGGKMTFAVGGAGTGTLMSITVTSKSILTTALEAYIFMADPTNTTWTNKTTPAINTADVASVLVPVSLSSPVSKLGTHTAWNAGGLGVQFVAANLYVILVAVSAATLTSTSTSDITVRLGIAVD